MCPTNTKLRSDQCGDVLMRLSAFIEGDLEDCCCGELAAHIESCPECARKKAEMEELIDLCKGAAKKPDVPELSSSFRERLRKTLCRESED